MSKRLPNDCFALPQGVNWTPVADALAHLRTTLKPVTGVEVARLAALPGRVLGQDVVALRDHPPFSNSAIDGYGFDHRSLPGAPDGLPLLEGRSAAGAPFEGVVPEGSAIRILTGAAPPLGVDTVVLQEDVTLTDGRVAFDVALKAGANIRAAGEDISEGGTLVASGRVLSAGDVAMLASAGVAEAHVRKRLRVAVLSTGSEVVEVGATPGPSQIFDANRPMLGALLDAWGCEVVDLGRVPDDRAAVLEALGQGAAGADVIVTSGGASTGDEDHISSCLAEADALHTWRIAVKPGRPLAMGVWDGAPVFGLPGNPVAAFVCALVFVRPSLRVLSGADWHEPLGFDLRADFQKAKKPGREEYLRARRRGDKVEVFASEGSGRVTGLSWADGVVALPHDQGPVGRGDLVRYIPFSEFGI